jgi:hypothetical protein
MGSSGAIAWESTNVPFKDPTGEVALVGLYTPIRLSVLARSADIASLCARKDGSIRKAKSEPKVRLKPRMSE